MARGRAAAARDPRRDRLPRRSSPGRSSADLEETEPSAAALRNTSTGCSRPGPSSSALLLLAEAIVGREVWRRRRWRAYLWPALLFALGVLMWPVMVFFTNSTMHMLAHSAWAQVMMLAGAAELGLVTGKLKSEWWRLCVPAGVRGLGRGVPDPRGQPVAVLAVGVRPPRLRLDPARRRALPARCRLQAALVGVRRRVRARVRRRLDRPVQLA